MIIRRLLLLALLLSLACTGAAVWWLQHPLSLPGATVDLSIEPGTSVRGVAQAVADAGVRVNPVLLHWCFRLSGQGRQIRAGSYEIEAGATPLDLLRKLVRGEEALRSVTLIEGWTFRQFRAALERAERLRPDTLGLADEAIMQRLERPGVAPEGRFFPDTYNYAKGSSDLGVLRRALHAMDRQLAAAWSLRAQSTPLKDSAQALTLASIVEKETGLGSDRSLIAGVFCNRLARGMPLQTDPSVIYGLGERFDGNLRRRDLLADTPWNTYTRAGLPPTPIAMPGRASLRAAVQPAPTQALYFVARGDGSSQFSSTLEEHNRAVNTYQRGR